MESRETPALIAGLDPSFAAGGKTTLNAGADDHGAAVAIQTDGKIVVAGTTNAGGGATEMVVARYNADGTPDAGFGAAGVANISFGTGFASSAAGVAVQADGRIVVAGYTNANGNDDFAVARLTTAGILDSSFDGDGKLTMDFGFGTTERATAVAIQTDGKIVAAGWFSGGVAGSNFAFLRLNPADGSPDKSFNGNGMQNVTIGASDFATALAIQPDGAIVAAGSTDLDGIVGNENDFAIVRLIGSTGALDTSFDGDGKATIDFGADDQAAGLSIQSTGRIVIAGSSDDGTSEIAVARLNGANGGLDASFDGDGKALLNPGTTSAAAGVATQWDGRILLVGSVQSAGADDFVVQRLLADGTPDPVFNGGSRMIDFGASDAGSALAVDPNGRVVVVGSTGAPGDFAIARLAATVEEGRRLAAGGSADGRAALLTPVPATGIYGAPASTPAGVFPGFAGAVRVTVADVNGDGAADTALITGPGTPVRFAVVNGKDNSILIPATAPFAGSEGFDGGGFIAAADFDNDGRAELVVTPDQGGGPRVTIFGLPADGSLTVRTNFLGIDDANFRGGARAAAGDVDGDGFQDLVVSAGFLGGPRAALFDGSTLFTGPVKIVNDFFAFPGSDSTTLRNGSFVALGDIDGDGFADLVFGGGPGGAPRVFILDGQTVAAGDIGGAYNSPLANFFVAGNSADRGGVRVAVTDADGDNRAEVVTGSGESSPAGVRIHLGKSFTSTGEPGGAQAQALFGGLTLAGGVYVG